MIFTLLALVLICSAISTGFYAACQFDGDEAYDEADPFMRKNWPRPNDSQKMIFWWVRYYGGRFLGKYWSKPIYSCLTCMGSFHSIAPVALYCHYYGVSFIIWPFIALATVGVNKLVTVWWAK